MGAQRKPAELLLLASGRGPGKDSAGRAVRTPPAFRRATPEPPPWLSEEAAAEWQRVAPGLARLDLLKEEDRAALSAYCETWATFVAATLVVQAEGLTIEARQGKLTHPAVGIARVAGRELRAFINHFGLSPSAEMALGKVSGDDDGEQNPFASATAT